MNESKTDKILNGGWTKMTDKLLMLGELKAKIANKLLNDRWSKN